MKSSRATPWRQQVALLIGVIAGSALIPVLLNLLQQRERLLVALALVRGLRVEQQVGVDAREDAIEYRFGRLGRRRGEGSGCAQHREGDRTERHVSKRQIHGAPRVCICSILHSGAAIGAVAAVSAHVKAPGARVRIRIW